MLGRKLEKQIEQLNELIQKANLQEISYLLGNKKELFFRNVLAGIGRGIGIGIGFTIITAVIIYFLQRLVRLNIPIIGEYVADIIEIVKQNKLY